MLPFIISALVLVMLVGPVMMMRPSSAQRKQAELRSLAAQKGLIVSGSEQGPQGQQYITYVLPVKRGKNDQTNWTLKRQKFAHEAHYCKEWDWLNSAIAGTVHDEAALKNLLEQESQDFLTLSADRLGVGVGWNEKLNGRTAEVAIEQLKGFLLRVEKLINP